VYDGQNTYADFDGAGALKERYLYGPAIDELLARTDSGGTSAWYLTDRLGSVRDIANTSGTVIDHLAYDSFGSVMSETVPANGDRFKFTGREYDVTTGQYDLRARYYNPATGRFLNVDPMGFGASDANLYRYVSNNPITSVDHLGTQRVRIDLDEIRNHNDKYAKDWAEYYKSLASLHALEYSVALQEQLAYDRVQKSWLEKVKVSFENNLKIQQNLHLEYEAVACQP
jgi:RHS repeat-associated protein